jgi:hypothetical protein
LEHADGKSGWRRGGRSRDGQSQSSTDKGPRLPRRIGVGGGAAEDQGDDDANHEHGYREVQVVMPAADEEEWWAWQQDKRLEGERESSASGRRGGGVEGRRKGGAKARCGECGEM